MPDLIFSPAHELHDALAKRELSAAELADAALNRIAEVNPSLNALVHVREEARAEAAASDARWTRGEPLGPLDGIPVVVKDNMNLTGTPTTCASRILEGYISPYTATAVQQLVDAGAVVVGKANMDEFAMGSSTEHSVFGPTRNPWNPSCVAGGSSGGSAAAVSAGLTPLGLGSDTGGSIRQPASFCGVVGVKPTYGRVSRFGLVAFGSSLDQIGPFARNVRDAANLLTAISGHDPRDSTSVNRPVDDFTAGIGTNVRGLTVGIPRELFTTGLNREVDFAVRGGLNVLADAGAELCEVSLPNIEYVVACYYIIAPAEASSNLSRFDGVRYGRRIGGDGPLLEMYLQSRSEGFGPEVQRRIMIGTYALSAGYYDAYYKRAQQVRTLVKQDFEAALTQCDVLLSPTVPVPPWGIGERVDDPLSMYLADICTIGANLTGNPAMSLPCGFTDTGLPIGLQLFGRPWDEATLFRVGAAFEAATDFHEQHPPVAAGQPS